MIAKCSSIGCIGQLACEPTWMPTQGLHRAYAGQLGILSNRSQKPNNLPSEEFLEQLEPRTAYVLAYSPYGYNHGIACSSYTNCLSGTCLSTINQRAVRFSPGFHQCNRQEPGCGLNNEGRCNFMTGVGLDKAHQCCPLSCVSIEAPNSTQLHNPKSHKIWHTGVLPGPSLE